LAIVGVVLLGTGATVVLIASGALSRPAADDTEPAELEPMSGNLVEQSSDGSLYFPANQAVINGDTATLNTVAGRDVIAGWTSSSDWVAWDFRVDEPAMFRAELIYATPGRAGGRFCLAINDSERGDMRRTASVRDTDGARSFAPHEIGFLTVRRSGRYRLTLRVLSKPAGQLMTLRAIRLTPYNVGRVRS
jgi:hypothetical protein